MAGINLTTQSVPVSDRVLNGGLNSTSGPLNLGNNESSDLQNIDFTKFGSILQRNGYSALNTTAITGTVNSDGLWWYEYNDSGTHTRKLINVTNGKLYKMDDLDITWDDITGTLTITADNFCDFDNFLNEVYITNGQNLPFKWNGSGNGSVMTVPTDLTKANHVKQFNNYLFLANVVVDGNTWGSRIYWSNLKDTDTWTATDFVEIARDNGQEITGLKVLNDRLVIFKERSIYTLAYTGDSDIPFILPGGGKTNSSVGCIAPWSIQAVDNGLVFLSHDGFYFFDGNNSYKISDKVTETILGFNKGQFSSCVSMVQQNKNKYWCAFTTSGATTNNRVMVWDFFNNAWSVYSGINASAMTTVYVDGIEERPYFADYAGFVYRADVSGLDSDYPANVETLINAYYWTNWKHYDDLINTKGPKQVNIFYQTDNSVLTFGYSYDFEEGIQYQNTFSLSTGTSVYGTAIYGTGTYAGSGGSFKRRDVASRGKVVRFYFANSTISEGFRIDGFGSLPHLETNV